MEMQFAEAASVVVLSVAAAIVGTTVVMSSRKKRKHKIEDEEDENVERPAKRLFKGSFAREDAPDETIVDLLKRRAMETPDKVVYIFLDDQGHESVVITFEELDRAARKVAATLQTDAGLSKGDRVMLCYPPGLDFAMGFWGCLYAGAIGIPTYPPYPGTLAKDLPKFNRMVADSGARVILTNRTYHLATQLATAKSYFSSDAPTWPKDIQWYSTDAISSSTASRFTDVSVGVDDVAFFQYSSGSTSEPKAVMISHGNIQAQLKTWASIEETDTLISWLPSYHDMGLVGFILTPCAFGARCVSMSPLAFIKDPAMWIRIASKYKGTHLCAPNFGYALAARKTSKAQVAKLDLSHLKQAICAAEPIRVESLEAFTETFAPAGFDPKTFNCGYGLAEVTLVVTGQDPKVRKEPSVLNVKKSVLEKQKRVVLAPKGHPSPDATTLVGCGHAMPTFKVIVVDPESFKPLGENQVGEVWIQGPSVAKGYWKREEYTAEMFHAKVKSPKAAHQSYKGNWLRSGDMGFLRHDEVFITGRLKDLIIIRGRNVCPQDVEHSVELAHDQVRPGCVAAFSIETAQQEEALVVVVELRADLRKDQDQLGAIARKIATSVLSEHQLRCAAIVLLKPRTIPKTTSGKIQRSAAKNQYNSGSLAAQYIHRADSKAAVQAVQIEEAPEEIESDEKPQATIPPTDVRTEVEIEAWLVARLAQEAVGGGETSDEVNQDKESTKASDKIDLNTPWACFGMDSVAIVSLSAELGEFLGVVVPPAVFFQYDTPAKLIAAPGLATGELSDSQTGEAGVQAMSYVGEDGEMLPECYDVLSFPEIKHLQGQMDELTAAGLKVPYLDVLTTEKRKQLNYNTYNYLGYASHPEVAAASKAAIDTYGTGMSSSPIVGQTIVNTDVEKTLCSHFNAEAAVLFVGGWVANVTTIDSLVGKGDLILCDVLNHNSCVTGQRLSGASILSFPHNDVATADRILRSVRHKYRRVLLVIEGVYSMDGDIPDLPAFVALKNAHKCLLFLDEAHSFGTMGATGKGMCEHFNIATSDVDVRMGTMSKAMGSVGGFILASHALIQYLKYCAGGFVYSVGLGPANAGATLKSLQLMAQEPERSTRLQELSAFFFDACVKAKLDVGTNVRGTCVVVVYVGSTVETVLASMMLSDNHGINVKPIVHPAVEEGKCRLRFFISYLKTEEELQRTVDVLVQTLVDVRARAAALEAAPAVEVIPNEDELVKGAAADAAPAVVETVSSL
ncbi:hypothetical protein H310_04641 [Aphanomyces invadans]|uniref:Carrier domain-containing protein n=1 Tax=Aphanomyces invadans TaxID=157072 RepID=A0A024UDR0_9STRA|nr:hypothetical protein H310_04641 [Aphanomyces invadans]ETW04345.1 hypothetical protein H310_04641 [Aphanomyces invadans]|eukprot:XP_008867301.1 hypothetical protein H310_04641 [Aphanomyces invadans]